MTVSRLVFSVDRDRQRLDRVHVNVRHLFRVLTSLCLSVTDFFPTSVFEAIEQLKEDRDEQAENRMRETLVENCRIEQHRRSRAGEFCSQRPNNCFRGRNKRKLSGFKTQAPRCRNCAQCILKRREDEEWNQENI